VNLLSHFESPWFPLPDTFNIRRRSGVSIVNPT
jgi:hypothetical protein